MTSQVSLGLLSFAVVRRYIPGISSETLNFNIKHRTSMLFFLRRSFKWFYYNSVSIDNDGTMIEGVLSLWIL